jgi:hypothetical protein
MLSFTGNGNSLWQVENAEGSTAYESQEYIVHIIILSAMIFSLLLS